MRHLKRLGLQCRGWPTDLDLYDVNRVPAPLDLLGSVSRLLDKDDAGETMLQVPEVHGRHAALKVTVNTEDTVFDSENKVGHQGNIIIHFSKSVTRLNICCHWPMGRF